MDTTPRLMDSDNNLLYKIAYQLATGSGGGGGGGAAQTPWAQNINGGGFQLSNASLYQLTLSGGTLANGGVLADSEVVILDGSNGSTAKLLVTNETPAVGYQAPIGSLTFYDPVGAYVKYGSDFGDWGEILHKDRDGITALGAFTGTMTGAASLNVLKAGDTMTGKLTITPVVNTNGLAISSYSLTGTNASSLADFSGTWNTSGTPTALKVNVTDTASNNSSLLADFQVGGVSLVSIKKNGNLYRGSGNLQIEVSSSNRVYLGSSFGGQLTVGPTDASLASNVVFGWSSDTTSFGTVDTKLVRDAANTLAQRNGTSAQTFRLYGTYTDASNYERFFVKTQAGNTQIGNEKLGTGSARALEIVSTNGVYINPNNSGLVWQFASSGHFLAQTDNTYDIGASGATRPRNIYAGTSVIINGVAADTIPTHSVTTYAATTNLDFGGDDYQTVSLTGNVTFTTSNKAAAKSLSIRIVADASVRTFTFPAWKFIGAAAPASIAASKTAILTLTAFGTNDTDIIAAYAVEP